MSVEERKIEIKKQLKKYENNLKYARVTNLTYSKEDWLIDRLATSEEKVKQLSAELKIAERQIKELIRKIK
jgi:hypothetical protein